ncbi:MAG: hypothetical protein LBE67_06755 [Kocuria palustris]|nr:hypothetical protein [Kocuria palustris]
MGEIACRWEASGGSAWFYSPNRRTPASEDRAHRMRGIGPASMLDQTNPSRTSHDPTDSEHEEES